MRILRLENCDKESGVILRVQVGEPEFPQLQGCLSNICLVGLNTGKEPIKVTKTGAKRSYAKWFLVPVKMRVQYNTEEFDCENTQLGCVEYSDKVLFLYVVGKRRLGEVKSSKSQ